MLAKDAEKFKRCDFKMPTNGWEAFVEQVLDSELSLSGLIGDEKRVWGS